MQPVRLFRHACILSAAAALVTGVGRSASDYTTPYVFSTLAGASSIGSTDGPGRNARFFAPRGVAVDRAGNVYVGDAVNQTIRKITPEGIVSTLAGTAGVFAAGISFGRPMTPQDIDGIGPDAKFANPEGIAIDASGTIYVADKMVSVIRKVTPAGAATTWVGYPQLGGSTDGTGSEARFYIPGGLAVDSAGNVYVAEWVTHIIRKITPAGVVSTLAGVANASGSADGTGSEARFSQPRYVAVDLAGNVYVGDTINCTVRKITPAGAVTTLAGLPMTSGSADGTGSEARFAYPSGITVDQSGNVYVSDEGNCTLRKITPAGVVTTLAGSAGEAGSTDGTGTAARFRALSGLTIDAAGNIYGADENDNTIRKITPAGVVTTVAGLGLDYAIGHNDGLIVSARFEKATQVAAGPGGTVYVSDTLNHTIRQISASGVVTTVAGSSTAFSGNNEDGPGSAARFSSPGPIAVDATGIIYVGELTNGTIRKIIPDKVVTTLNGVGLGRAQFDGIGGIATDSAGEVYVTDNHRHTINKISSAGVITILAGKSGIAGHADGSATDASFNQPEGIVGDSSGNFYVTDAGNQSIRKITSAGMVTTVAGGVGLSGDADGPASTARFNSPSGIALDPAGNLFVADSSNSTIRRITPAGIVSTVAGRPGTAGIADGTGREVRFNNAEVISVDSTGKLLVSNSSTIQKGELAGPPVITNQPSSQTMTAGGNVQLSVTAGGAPTPTYQWYFGTSAISGATTNTLTITNASSANAGDYTVVVTNSLGTVASSTTTLTVTVTPTPPPPPTPDPEVYSTAYYFSTFAGTAGGPGDVDGVGTTARYHGPTGIAVGTTGNIYIGDTDNHTIRKISPSGVVTTFAGTPGVAGSADGTGSTARFKNPQGVAVDTIGNVYVADAGNSTIRKITPAGIVTTLAGSAGISGALLDESHSNDGTGSTARFVYPVGVAVDSAGNVYVADSSGQALRKITSAGIVTTVAVDRRDGVTYAGIFSYPTSVATDAAGNVYVGNMDKYPILKFTPDGGGGVINGTYSPGSDLTFGRVMGMAVDTAGNIYLEGDYGSTIQKITPAGLRTTLAGSTSVFGGSSDGTGSAAQFFYPGGITVDSTGNIYVADTGNHKIRKITASGTVTTISGSAAESGSIDDVGQRARFSQPSGIAMDRTGNIFVADSYNHTIRKIAPNGTTSTVAGTAGMSGSVDGTGTGAKFNFPIDVAVDGTGNLYVADFVGNMIRMIDAKGVVSTLAGAPGVFGGADGSGTAAQLHYPTGVAVDISGNVLVADDYNSTIRKITPAGEVTTLAGLAGTAGWADGTGSNARFYYPNGVAVDNLGNVFVADAGNNAIRKISPLGEVTTLAGLAGQEGSADGTGSEARFRGPARVFVDATGNLYVTDNGNHTIRKVTATGVVTTLGGAPGLSGTQDGVGDKARFYFPNGIALDREGKLYVASRDTHNIHVGQLAVPPTISTQPQNQTATAGDSVQFSVTAGGVPAPTYQWYFNGSAFSSATSNILSFSKAHSTDAGDYTVVVTNSLGSVTSNKASLTIAAAPVQSPTPTSSPASGGGSIGAWFALGLLMLIPVSRWRKNSAVA